MLLLLAVSVFPEDVSKMLNGIWVFEYDTEKHFLQFNTDSGDFTKEIYIEDPPEIQKASGLFELIPKEEYPYMGNGMRLSITSDESGIFYNRSKKWTWIPYSDGGLGFSPAGSFDPGKYRKIDEAEYKNLRNTVIQLIETTAADKVRQQYPELTLTIIIKNVSTVDYSLRIGYMVKSEYFKHPVDYHFDCTEKRDLETYKEFTLRSGYQVSHKMTVPEGSELFVNPLKAYQLTVGTPLTVYSGVEIKPKININQFEIVFDNPIWDESENCLKDLYFRYGDIVVYPKNEVIIQ